MIRVQKYISFIYVYGKIFTSPQRSEEDFHSEIPEQNANMNVF